MLLLLEAINAFGNDFFGFGGIAPAQYLGAARLFEVFVVDVFCLTLL
jgi:uncharacterized membrane protein YtjA (UPF0391 family)